MTTRQEFREQLQAIVAGDEDYQAARLQARIETNVLKALNGPSKVPYTTAGMAMITDVIKDCLEANGAIDLQVTGSPEDRNVTATIEAIVEATPAEGTFWVRNDEATSLIIEDDEPEPVEIDVTIDVSRYSTTQVPIRSNHMSLGPTTDGGGVPRICDVTVSMGEAEWVTATRREIGLLLGLPMEHVTLTCPKPHTVIITIDPDIIVPKQLLERANQFMQAHTAVHVEWGIIATAAPPDECRCRQRRIREILSGEQVTDVSRSTCPIHDDCDDCKNTGWYVGFSDRRPCPTCQGDSR